MSLLSTLRVIVQNFKGNSTEDEVEGRLLLHVVIIGQGTAVLKLLSGEDETLLVWWDSFFVLDFGFDVALRPQELMVFPVSLNEDLRLYYDWTLFSKTKLTKIETHHEIYKPFDI